MDTDSSNIYLTENILTDGYCLSPYTCKMLYCFKQLDGLNFDGLAGKHQKHQNFPLSKNFCYTLYTDKHNTHTQTHILMNIHT